MKLIRKISGLLLVCLLGTTAQAQTINSDAQLALDLAGELYPDLFSGGSALKVAQGYTYTTFSSGVSVGFKDGSLFLAGGPFGAAIQNKGSVTAVRASLEGLKSSVMVTPTADMTSVFNLAAQLYPTIFSGPTSLKNSADGYLYRYYVNSGVYAAIKNGQVYVKGGTYGNAYTSVGALNAVLTKLQTAVNGGGSTGGGTTIPQGNFKLVVSGTVTIGGIVSISQPFSFQIDNMPAPDVSDQDDIKEAFETALQGQTGVTITSFTYNVVESSANRVEFNVTVQATIAQNGLNMSYGYALNYKYTK